MAETPDWSDWRRLVDVGMQFTAVTRAEAQRRAQELVREGQLAQERAQSFVDDLVRTSRERADDLVDVVRQEIHDQIEALGIATKADLDRLEARMQQVEQRAVKQPAAKKRATKKQVPKAAKRAGSADARTKSPSKKKAGTRKPSGSS